MLLAIKENKTFPNVDKLGFLVKYLSNKYKFKDEQTEYNKCKIWILQCLITKPLIETGI